MIAEAIARKLRPELAADADTIVVDTSLIKSRHTNTRQWPRLGTFAAEKPKINVITSKPEEHASRPNKRAKIVTSPDDSDTELDVDDVIDKRLVTEYLVSYGGQGREGARWVKKSQIQNSKLAIKTYNRRFRSGDLVRSPRAIGRPIKSSKGDLQPLPPSRSHERCALFMV